MCDSAETEYKVTRTPYGRDVLKMLAEDGKLLFTRRWKAVYVHVTAEPEAEAIVLRPMAERPARATPLNTGRVLEAEVVGLPRLWSRTPNRCLRVRGVPEGMAGAVVKLEY